MAKSDPKTETPEEVLAEIRGELDAIGVEVVKAFGVYANPRHPKLRNDIENAYLVALASPTLRHAVARSLAASEPGSSRGLGGTGKNVPHEAIGDADDCETLWHLLGLGDPPCWGVNVPTIIAALESRKGSTLSHELTSRSRSDG